jgi:hypothetical protein
MALVLGLVFSLGAHWAILQSVAWASMFVTYSRSGSICEALIKTFDGQHPCALCIFVAAGKKADDQTARQVIQAPQLDLFVQTPAPILLLETTEPPMCPFLEHWNPRSERPPSPPPRIG